MSMKAEIKRLGFLSVLPSVSEITLENKPDTPKMDKLPNICKLESISPVAKGNPLRFSSLNHLAGKHGYNSVYTVITERLLQ